MEHFAISEGTPIGSITAGDNGERMEIRYHAEGKMSARFEDSEPEWIAEGDGVADEDQSRQWMRDLYRGRTWGLIEFEVVANG